MTMPQSAVHDQAAPKKVGKASPAGVFGWIMFDWAQQPFYTLVTTFLFSAYFANVFVGDASKGFALWGYATAAAGFIVAILSPVFGSIADETGRLKNWIAGFSALFVMAQAALWFAVPGEAWLIGPIVLALVVAAASAEFAAAFNNAMMSAVVSRAGYGRLSGTGWAVGYAGGLVALVLVTGFVMTDSVSGLTMLGIYSPFNLDASFHQAERLIGPLSAAWYLLFIIPLFLFTPDLPKRDIAITDAARRGLSQLRTTIASLRHMPDIVRFLIARMLYTDALLAIFTFGGIYAASLFGWSALQLGINGIILSVAAAIGALCGGFLDDALGAKPVILGALGLLIAGLSGILAIDSGMASAAIGAGAFWGMEIAGFTRPAEGVYLVCSVLVGIAAGPLQASSRSLLARMAPPDRITEFFGLYAFSGKITAFLAPFVVGLVTTLTGSQRIGLAAILVFLLASVAVFVGIKGNGMARGAR